MSGAEVNARDQAWQYHLRAEAERYDFDARSMVSMAEARTLTRIAQTLRGIAKRGLPVAPVEQPTNLGVPVSNDPTREIAGVEAAHNHRSKP